MLVAHALGGLAYVLGWTGGFCLVGLLIAPRLRAMALYTVPEPFVGRLADALRSLGQEDGRLVLLVAVHGYGFREVAEQLNLSEDVARKRWQRARARLFAQLPAAAPDAPGIPRRPSSADLKEPLR